MKKMVGICLMNLLLVAGVCQTPDYVENGNLRAQFGPGGATAPTDGAFLELKDGEDWVSLIYDAGLFVAGLDQGGNLKTYTTRGTTVTAGILGIDAEMPSPWRVTRDEIEAHLADYADNGVVDNPIPSIFSWPGSNNPYSLEYNGFEAYSMDFYQNLAPYWDMNFNAFYEPDKGDYPIFSVRGCLDQEPVIPTELLFFPIVLTSSTDEESKMKLFMTVARYGCEEGSSVINNTIFVNYQISNIGAGGLTETLDSTYFGYWLDGDVGCFSEDYLGVDSLRSAVYFYNASPTDGNCNPEGSFGEHPPVVGIDFLRGPYNENAERLGLERVMPVLNASSAPAPPSAVTDYTSDNELYNYLSGHWRDGSPLLDTGFGYESGEPTNLAFTGDPVQGTGWTETGEGNAFGDRRAILSTGPFTLLPGALNEVIMAFTYHADPAVDNLEQIDGLRAGLDTLQAFFDGCFGLGESPEMTGCTPIVTAVNTPKGRSHNELLIYPNPAREQVTIETPETGLLHVYTANGKLLLQKRTFSERTALNLLNWPRGLYLLRWEGGKEVFVNKLLVD